MVMEEAMMTGLPGNEVLLTFQRYAERVKPRLDASFELTLEELLAESPPSSFPDTIPALTAGKKVRGVLLCLVAETLGGELSAALPRAVAVEMIQSASLIHDDFVDQHPWRRNHRSLWSLEGARRAVLLGDVIFAAAIRMMSELGSADCRIVSDAISELSLGAYQEPLDPQGLLLDLERGRFSSGEAYRRIIYLKTAILFGAACELGALAACAPPNVAALWRRYGVKIGEAYQIADDLQEVEGALAGGGVGGVALTSLAPALLFFDRELLPLLLQGVRSGELEVGGEVAERFRVVGHRMREEREERLAEAVASVSQGVREDLLGQLVLKTPWELISIFDAASSAVCAP